MVGRIKSWNRWRKNSLNSAWYKFLVLIGFVHSPSWELERSIEKFIEERYHGKQF